MLYLQNNIRVFFLTRLFQFICQAAFCFANETSSYLFTDTHCLLGKINIKKKRNNNDERWWKNIHNLRIIWHCVCLCLCLYLQEKKGNFGRWYFLSHSSFSPGSIHTKASFLFFSLVHRKSMLKVYHLSCEIGEWEREREKEGEG